MRDDQLARSFGIIVRRLRLARGWSQEELAARCGLHRTFIGSIERGEKTVSIATAKKIAESLDLSLSLLFLELEHQLE